MDDKELYLLGEELIHRFTEAGKTFGTAESLTAGMIAAAAANVPGASRVLMGGVVSYDPRIKEQVLGVSREIIDGAGVVSEACARAMAEGARRLLAVDIAVSATGLAGPGGGTPQTPVGTVYIAVSSKGGTRVEECHFSGSRETVRQCCVYKAFHMALDTLHRDTGIGLPSD